MYGGTPGWTVLTDRPVRPSESHGAGLERAGDARKAGLAAPALQIGMLVGSTCKVPVTAPRNKTAIPYYPGQSDDVPSGLSWMPVPIINCS